MTTFSDLNLAAPLDKALRSLGYENPTPIQAEAIPHLMKGRDLMGIAQTGTGKTAAFALPSLHHIFTNDAEPPKRGARVLCLAPTRELASQITESFTQYGKYMEHFTVTTIYGGVPIQRQIKRMVHGNDVVVATPGRLIDLLDRKAITLKDIEILILDEADQMMDMGFIHALRKIIPLLPKQRQTLFFSATMAPNIKKLASQFLTDPIKVAVSPANTTAERVTQSLVFAEPTDKQYLLPIYLLRDEVKRSLVFTRTKHGADRVVKRLGKVGLAAVAIHGNKSQGQRQRALEAFRSGSVDILVATDVAARGIDIPGITHVFNYEIPNVAEQYVHRIGRTARANTDGRAIAFVAKDERSYLKDIERLLKEKITVEQMPSDMAEQIKIVQARNPIVVVSDHKPETRKGRGKSKKKARFSKGQANKSVRSRHEQEPHDRSAKSGYNPEKPSESAGGKPFRKRAPSRDDKPRERRAFDGENRERNRKPKPNGEGNRSAQPKTADGGKTQGKPKPAKKSRAQRKNENSPASPAPTKKSGAKRKPYMGAKGNAKPSGKRGGDQPPKRRAQ